MWVKPGRPTPLGCSPFCTIVHSFPQPKFQIPLAKKNGRVYPLPQIEPGSLKNLTAQLKEGAAAARQLRPQSFLALFLALPESLCPARRESRVVESLKVLAQLPDAQGKEAPPALQAAVSRVRAR